MQAERVPRRRLWRRDLAILASLVAPFAFALVFATEFRWEHLPSHSAIEAIGGLIAIALATILRASRDPEDSGALRWMSLGLLAMGILDIGHSLVGPGDLFVWLHSLANFAGGMFFALVWVPPPPLGRRAKRWMALTVAAAAIVICVGSLLLPGFVPVMQVDGEFTTLAVALNVLGGLGFLAAAVWFMGCYLNSRLWSDGLFASLAVLFGLAGVLFQHSTLWDFEWWWWHLLRLLAYGLAITYVAFLYYQSHRRLEIAEGTLTRQRNDLTRTNRRLAAKNQELDEFTYVASHDLQEPLRALTSFSELLIKDLGEDIPERARTDLHFITDAATRMRGLVQDLLALSRSGRRELTLDDVPLDECVDRALEALQSVVDQSGAEIVRVALPTVSGDRRLLTQLYQNLIGNGIKFARDGVAPIIRIGVEPGSDGLELTVSDNGIGIDPQYHQVIFRPFKRLHGREAYPGTGIGLGICSKVVERHGGRIWVHSETGAGATFRFVFGEPHEREEADSLDSLPKPFNS